MSCTEKAAKDIANTCDYLPRAGFEKVAWAINRADIDTVTYDGTIENLVSAITLNSGTYAYQITAVKKEANGGFDLATGDDVPDTFLNYFAFKPYEQDAQSIQNMDQMQDLVIIAELKGAKTEGCFVIYGLENGLIKTSGTKRQLDNNGLPVYEFASEEGQGERYSRFSFWNTDYTTSLAALTSLITSYGPALNVSTCVNTNYTGFGGSPTPTSFEATSNGADTHVAGTADEIVLTLGKTYLVEFTLTLNSGTAPSYDLFASPASSPKTAEGPQLATSGSNSFVFTCNAAATCTLSFYNTSTVTDYGITNLSVKEAI